MEDARFLIYCGSELHSSRVYRQRAWVFRGKSRHFPLRRSQSIPDLLKFNCKSKRRIAWPFQVVTPFCVGSRGRRCLLQRTSFFSPFHYECEAVLAAVISTLNSKLSQAASWGEVLVIQHEVHISELRGIFAPRNCKWGNTATSCNPNICYIEMIGSCWMWDG